MDGLQLRISKENIFPNVFRVLGLAGCLSPTVLFGAQVPDLTAEVDYVFDGDTFSARVNFENGASAAVRVRIRNIDAPEIHGECAYETGLADKAKIRLSEILPNGTKVALSKIKDDKYLGRIDALVNFNGADVGEIMMKEKLARKYDGGKRASWCEKNKGAKNDG